MPRLKAEPTVSNGTSCKQISSTSFSKLKGGDKIYQEAIEAARSFNKRLIRDRKMRIPFIDSQTRVAQANSMFWLMEYQRREADDLENSELDNKNNYVYFYPNKKWYKQRRLHVDPFDTSVFPHAIYRSQQNPQIDENSNSMDAMAFQQHHSNSSIHQNLMKQTSVSNDYDDDSNHHHGHANGLAFSHIINEDSFENLEDPENDSDDNDYEDKKKKKRGKRKKKEEFYNAADDKSFVCDRCGAKYKTKPGLVYHVQKAHMKKSTNGQSNGHQNHHTPKVESIPPDENTTNSMYESGVDDMNSTSSVSQTNGSTQKNGHGSRCGICNGNETENRMHQAEKLISCHECQKQFHPTCLNFSQTMLQSVKKYNWQCIECKKCTHCGNSENDDKLLFCDECDRGFHMYCLKPPLQEAPDGDWRCELCAK